MKSAKKYQFSQGAIAVAVSLLFQSQPLLAQQPTGAQVINGTVSMVKPNATTLNITNTPGAIIQWQGFSIGAGETTRFIQQSSSSAVLNRVVGVDISAINGQLLSNGRVFLINPAGILIGPSGSIDTAGFVGSTLKMLDADFLAGKLRFSGDASSGSIINQGWIRTSFGGNVLLVAPRIENSGLIQTPGGELILAAGQKVTVSSLDQEGVQFEVQAPTDSVVNVGQLLASGGAVGVFAGSIKHSGDIRANALIRDEGGNIVLKAANDIQIAAGSSISASGKTGGTITIESGTATRVAGQVLATGTQGKGGGITLLGERVTAADGALIDASGTTGGGQILLGGDYQGANAAVRNATTTFVGAKATLRADATDHGDGGRIIVWGNENTRFYGSLSAQGGPQGGNGGFAEVSGAQNLIFAGTANLGASKGALGNLLLDPLDLYVFTNGGIDSAAGVVRTSGIADEATDFPSNAVTISPGTLAGIAGNVTLYASRYMRIGNDITLTTPGQSLTATVGTYAAPALPDPVAQDNVTPNRLEIGTDIATGKGVNITTTGGAVTLNAPLIQGITTSKISTAGGAITLISSGAIQASQLSLDAGGGAVTATPGSFLQLSAVTGGSFTATSPSSISIGGLITTFGGPVSLSSTGSSISTSGASTGGGAFTMTSTVSSVNNGGTILAGGGAVSMTGTSVSGGTIDTTGAVGLNATAGSISATINNSNGVSATSANSFSSTSININSTTALNANSITATAVNCSSSFSCPGANISLTATGDINVGVLTANAPATTNNASVFNNAISRGITLTSNGGSIRAQGPATLITATDVTLNTLQGSGGGIGAAAAPLNVNTERLLSVSPNGDFNVVAVGTGPTRLNAQLGVAATGKTYTGTLTRSAGGLTLNATATDTTVTVSNFAATGFTQRLYSQNPSITLGAPNGALTITAMSVPEGDTRPNDPPFTVPLYSTATLPVSVSANGDLTVTAYTRQNTGASLPKTTSFSSSTGMLTLGAIAAGKDSVTASSFGAMTVNSINTTGGSISLSTSGAGSNISATSLSAPNGVTVSASNGDVTVGSIDTTSGTGSVSLAASSSTGAVKALTDSGALEITSGGSISVSAKTIGTSGFANPLDMAGSSIALTSTGATGGAIGFAGAPIIANTQNLTINASPSTSTPTTNGASFNVNTGATALRNLTVTANAQAVGVAGPGTVTTEGGVGVYNFASDGTNFTFNAGTVSANQFTNGALNFTSNSGNVTLGAADLGTTGSLSITARNGSILGGATLDGGGAINLSAGQSLAGAAVAVTVGNIGLVNRPTSLAITSGNNGTFTSRAGPVTAGNIEAGGITINSFNGNMKLGNVGAVARAGGVSLTSGPIGGVHGSVQTGNITAASLTISDDGNNITTGNLDATAGVAITSLKTVTLGNVNAASLSVTTPACAICDQPLITTGAISGVQSLSLFGEAVTINGSVTGDPAGTGTLNIRAGDAFFGGTGILNITGGSVTAGDGSTIDLTALSAAPFKFTTLNAGATGTVNVNARGGIQQIAPGGITAKTVNLTATDAAAPINQVGGDGLLDLTGTQALGINAGGPVALDANGSTLSALSITKTATPAAAAFALSNLGGGQAVSLTGGGADLALTVSSAATPLNFSLNYSAGKTLLAGTGITTGGGNVALTGGFIDATVGGINTSGGNVTVNSAGFNATGGGITTGGATGGGAVDVFSSGLLTTGVINTTPTGTGTGGAIALTGNNGGILVNGNLTTGTGGGAISLNATNAGITTSGGAQIVSDTSVSVAVNAAATDVGAGAAPLLITAPTVTLSASHGTGGGSVFATLTNTKSLTLSGDSGFNVASNTALDTLSAATRGTKAGVLTLTAPGQTYTFARPTTDLFGGAMTNTFQVVAAAGTTPAVSATFTAIDGDLFVGGAGTSITTAALSLGASSAGDVKLQGTAANPLALTNATQNIGTGSTRDVLIRGNIALTGATQNITANRSITVQAEQGTVSIAGGAQTIASTGVGGGVISFKGGAAANETVAVTASTSQLIQSPDNGASAAIRVEGGDGMGSSATVVYTGVGTQTVQAGGNVSVKGGLGDNAIAEIRTATGSQFISANLNLDVTGGAGIGAAARIVNTGAGNQQVGEARRSFSFVFPYQTNNLTVAAGAGNDAIAEITAAGPQQVLVSSGTLAVLGGSGTNSFARIDNAAATQQIGCVASSSSCAAAIGTINLLAGTGAGAYARATSAGQQNVSANSAINLTGSAAVGGSAAMTGAGQTFNSFANVALTAGTGSGANALVQSSGSQNAQFSGITLTGGGGVGATATAQMFAAGSQTISGSTTKLTGGAGDNSLAQMVATGFQSLSFGNTTLAGGAGNNAFAQMVSSGASQSLNYSTLNMTGGLGAGSLVQIVAATTQNISGGNMTLTGGGTAVAPVANSYALIQGNSQTISASNLTLNGGNGAVGNASDAVLRNLSGNQSVSANGVTLNGGAQFSTTGILNQGAGTQSVSGSNGILLTTVAGANNNTSVLIQNASASKQTLTATNGGIGVINQGAGAVSVTSGGAQQLTSRFVEVSTAAGSTGDALLSAASNQWIRTTDGSVTRAAPFATTKQSMLVTALGTGKANIESGASQLIQLDYPDQFQAVRDGALTIGGTTAAGVSRIGAVDQTLFVKSLTVQTGTGARSELKASNKQVVTVLNGGLNVLGGSGANTLAQIDPVDQTLLVNGAVTVQGGSGANASALINSAGTQTLMTTNGGINVTGGAGAGSTAIISAAGNQIVSATGAATVLGGAAGALARIATTANQTFNFGSLNMMGGTGAGSLVEVTAGGTQALRGGNVSLSGGGNTTAVPNASAIIQGNSQMIAAANLNLTAGAGTAAGNSDAILRNLSGDQVVSASGVGGLILNSNAQFSTAGIINQGAGVQTVAGTNGIFLDTVPGANSNTSVLIQNTPATLQTIFAGAGGVGLINRGSGVVAVTSGGTQSVTARFVDVVTRSGSTGDSILSAAGNQTIHTTDGTFSSSGSLRATAFGTGKANIESGANQSLELDYPEQLTTPRDGRLTVGDTAAAGLSRIGAVNQTIFAKSIRVQTGATGSRSEIKSSGVQVIRVLNGDLDVLGGSGNNTLAQIDPINQNIVVNGNLNIIGGTGINAVAQVVSAGIQNITANSIFVTGGSGAGSSAALTATGLQTLNGNLVITQNVGGAMVTGGAPVSVNTTGSVNTGNVLSLQDNQLGVIASAEPEDQNETDPIRRAPQCF